LQEGKRKLLLELRHSPDEELDEEAAMNSEDDRIIEKDEPSILSIFFTIQGAYIILSFIVFLAINYALDVMDSKPKGKKIKTR
jgi:hypothetical protein